MDYQFGTLRDRYPRNDYMQDVLGPIDHGYAVQDFVQNSPVSGLLASPLGIPAYTLLKALSKGSMGDYMPEWLREVAGNARSRPSLDEIIEGYKGYGRGIKGLISQ